MIDALSAGLALILAGVIGGPIAWVLAAYALADAPRPKTEED